MKSCYQIAMINPEPLGPMEVKSDPVVKRHANDTHEDESLVTLRLSQSYSGIKRGLDSAKRVDEDSRRYPKRRRSVNSELLPQKALRFELLGGAINSPFFELPREIRDMVYDFVLAYPEGFHFDEFLSQLRIDGRRPPDLTINFVRHVMRGETLHLALKVNKLSFGSDLIADNGRGASVARSCLFMGRRSPEQRAMVRNIELIEDVQRRSSGICIEYLRPTIYPNLAQLCSSLPLLRVKVYMRFGCFYCLVAKPPLHFKFFSRRLIAQKWSGSKITTSVKFSMQVPSIREQQRVEVLWARNLLCPLFSWSLDNREAIEEINGIPWTPTIPVD
ncbi:hypothetical protein AOQ84DRAFT_361622 [Glonium stellatum]|uniref:Uncharacterized protein n=1 Tax=Glonium stellatum TaxID=574774 RepID=A0A8E2F691_9PEZI|nr:hypothetical protein AOQ84DRAFT_361622 [Glonium stellatum]